MRQEEGRPCRRCGGEIIKKKRVRPLTNKELNREWNYSAWLKCKACRAIFLREEWKIFRDSSEDMALKEQIDQKAADFIQGMLERIKKTI